MIFEGKNDSPQASQQKSPPSDQQKLPRKDALKEQRNVGPRDQQKLSRKYALKEQRKVGRSFERKGISGISAHGYLKAEGFATSRVLQITAGDVVYTLSSTLSSADIFTLSSTSQ